MKVLSIGNIDGICNTCLHRLWALKKIFGSVDVLNIQKKKTILGRIIHRINLYSPIKFNAPDLYHINEKIINQVQANQYDLIWIDKGSLIYPSTLKEIKKLCPNCILVHYIIIIKRNCFPYLFCHMIWVHYIINHIMN